MPSGARKRRAARRKKEQLRTGVVSSTAFPGNLEMEDDLSSPDGRGSESSSSELTSPVSWDDHRHRLVIETEEQINPQVERANLAEKAEIERNGETKEHSSPQNGKDEIQVEEAPPPPVSQDGPDSPKSEAVPATELESTFVEHKLEKIECAVPPSEHAVREGLEATEIVAEPDKCEEEKSLSSFSNEPARKVEVKDQSLKLERRSTLMSCCGLLDVFAGGNQKKSG